MTTTATRPADVPVAPRRRRTWLTGVVLIAVTVAAAVTYIVVQPRDTGTTNTVDLTRADTLVYVSDTGRVTQVDSRRRVLATGPVCQRVYAAAGTMICLRSGSAPMSSVITVDRADGKRLELTEWGSPSRARVSPSGNLVTWTVFRSGDSYLVAGAFATTAGIYDLSTNAHYGSLEDFTVQVDGKPYGAEDRNFWGVTFTDDDRTFYATMSSAGRAWLVHGDLSTRTLTALRPNVECPSLSPDGTRIAYKHRTGDQWRLHVLTLATNTDTRLAEPSDVDDQPTWLTNETIAYSRPHNDKPAIFTVPASGAGSPRLLLPNAASPTPIR